MHRALEGESRAIQREIGKVKAKLKRVERNGKAPEVAQASGDMTTRNQWPLKTERNGYRPPVERKCLAKKEGGKGTRLIVRESLKRYLAEQRQ